MSEGTDATADTGDTATLEGIGDIVMSDATEGTAVAIEDITADTGEDDPHVGLLEVKVVR